LFPKPRGDARVDDRKVLSDTIHVIHNGLRWQDAPLDYGPYRTLYNRFRRWSENDIFERILLELAIPEVEGSGVLMIDAKHLKADRTASSLKKGAMSKG
jgi:putative transposase